MASNSRVCCLCGADCPLKAYISLLSVTGIQQKWCIRIQSLLTVEVCTEKMHGPMYMCCKCQRKVEHLGKAREELKQFAELAKRNTCKARCSSQSTKRTREVSRLGTSPDTGKRVRQRLDFDQGNYLSFVPISVVTL